jgi:hypothetical protein
MQQSKAVYRMSKYSAYEFTHDYTCITDVLDRLNARPEYDDATIIEGTPQEVFSQTALYTELNAPMFLSIFGNYQTVSAVGFAEIKPYREEIYLEDSAILSGISEALAQASYEVYDLQDMIPTLSGEDIDELHRIISSAFDEVYRLAVLLPTDRPRKKATRK